MFINEENVRVPYMIAMPRIAAAVRARTLASVIDTAPTVLDLIGLPPMPEYQGTSLLSSRRRRAFFLADYSLGFLGLREDCWKYVFEVNSGRSTLFDVCRDPGERADRSNAAPEQVEAYRAAVESWSLAQRRLVRGRSGPMRADGHADDRDEH
jgi:arylsulfatase A-like enzyme